MTTAIDDLIRQLQELPDPAARAVAIDLVQAVMSLHKSALERILERAPEAAPRIAADDLVSSVLAMHGLHPDGFGTRLGRVIQKLQKMFDSRGIGIQVVEAGPDLVRVQLTGGGRGAGPAREIIEDAIYDAVPEVGALFVESADQEPQGFVPLKSLLQAMP